MWARIWQNNADPQLYFSALTIYFKFYFVVNLCLHSPDGCVAELTIDGTPAILTAEPGATIGKYILQLGISPKDE